MSTCYHTCLFIEFGTPYHRDCCVNLYNLDRTASAPDTVTPGAGSTCIKWFYRVRKLWADRGFYLYIFYNKIIDDDGVAPGTKPHSTVFLSHTEGLWPRSIHIRESYDLDGMNKRAFTQTGRNDNYLVFETLKPPPSAHYKWIVGCQDSDHIHSFCFKFVVFLDVRR